MKLYIHIAVVLALAGTVFAGEVVWDTDKPDGSYDLNNKDNWTSGSVPTASDTVKFPEKMKNRNYTFTTSGDLRFQKFSLTFGNPTTANGDGNNITLDLGVDREMELEGVEDESTMRIDGQNSTLILKSGTIKPTEGVTFPRYFMANVLRDNNKVFVDGANSRMIFDAIKFVSPNSLFCVTNGGYVQSALLCGQPVDFKTTIQVTGEGSMWNLHTNRLLEIDGVSNEISGNKMRYPLCLGRNGSARDHNLLLKVDKKGVLTNFCGYVGYNCRGVQLLVDDATVYGRDAVNVGRFSAAAGNSVEVLNGGRITGNQYFHIGQEGRENRLRISGPGSAVDCEYFYAGFQQAGKSNVAEVVNGGFLRGSQWFSVGEEGKWNTLRIDGVGSTGECRRLRLAANTNAAYNVIEIANGGVVKVWGREFHAGMDKDISGFLPFGAGHDNRLSITGAGSRLEFINLVYAGESETATNNLIEVADGGLLYGSDTSTSGWSVIYLNNCAHNTVRVRDGGKMELAQFSMGMTDGGENSISNVLEIIGEDSVVNVRHKMYLNGVDNVLTISNGQLRVSTDSRADSEYLNFSQAEGRSSVLNLEGETPRIEAKRFSAKNTKITFKIPEGGFAEGPIVKATHELTVDATCSLEIVAEHSSDKTAILMQCEKNQLDVAASVIDKANSTGITGRKAKVYRIVKSADGRQLLLKPNNGMLIIFR